MDLPRPAFRGYRILRDKGVKRFGLHTMVASNELNPDYFVETAQMLFELVVEISTQLKIRFDFVNLGGASGFPTAPPRPPSIWHCRAQDQGAVRPHDRPREPRPVRIAMECGRMITGPYGYLVTRVLHKKAIYKNYVGLDACMANLMRPGMYGSYHHITVPGKEQGPKKVYDVTAPSAKTTTSLPWTARFPIRDRRPARDSRHRRARACDGIQLQRKIAVGRGPVEGRNGLQGHPPGRDPAGLLCHAGLSGPEGAIKRKATPASAGMAFSTDSARGRRPDGTPGWLKVRA